MIHLMLSALIGGFATSALFWTSSAALAIALAPLGGSLAAATAAALLGWHASRARTVAIAAPPSLDQQIAMLRSLAAQGRRTGPGRSAESRLDDRAA